MLLYELTSILSPPAYRMAARSRTTAKRDAKRAEREEEMGQRRTEYRAKEDATMDMFKAMAKERFG